MSDVVDALSERMGAAQAELRERGQAARHARMREQVLSRAAEPRASAGSRGWAWPLAAGAVAAAVLVGWLAVRPVPLTFEVQGAGEAGMAQAFVAAGDDAPLELSFSDGSAVTLRPRTRVRVGALRDDGADLVLESGTVEATLEPHTSGSWTIAAGPYRVITAGTAFWVRWVPETETFELELTRGAVTVQGPGIDGAREVAEGERVVIAGRREVAAAEGVRPGRAEDAAEEPDAIALDEAELAAPEAEPEPRASGRRGSGSKPARAGGATGGSIEGWRTLAHQGSYREAIAAAEAAGFSRLCSSLDAAALLELADAGRYARKTARAREALLALRKRFPGTEAAAAASFDLGRLASGGSSGCGDATQWFRTYLRERPQGSMADAARHRIDECAALEEAGANP